MIMSIEKIVSETKRLGLSAPPECGYLQCLFDTRRGRALVEEIANGVGSETNILYHFTPDTIWGLNINPTSHTHDWMYTFPLYFPSFAAGMAWKHLADDLFRENGERQIADAFCLLRPLRRLRLAEYDAALSNFGKAAFWADKPLPRDFAQSGYDKPAFDPARVKRLHVIEHLVAQVCPEYTPCPDAILQAALG